MIKTKQIPSLEDYRIGEAPVDTLVVTGECDLAGVSLAALSRHVNRRLVFKKRPKLRGRYDNTIVARSLMAYGFQVFDTVRNAYKINSICQFNYTDPRYIDYVLYAVAYGSDPNRVRQLLAQPVMQCTHMYELMGGSAELSLYGMADYPHIQFTSVDIDDRANRYVWRRAQAAGLQVYVETEDVTQFEPYRNEKIVNACFIGKQSINYFDPLAVRDLLEHLLVNYDVIALELLTPIDAYKNYHSKHECDWLPRGQQLVERFCSDQPERPRANPVTSRLAFSLFLEHIDKGQLLNWHHVSAYDWWMYNLQSVVHMMMQMGIATSDMWYYTYGNRAAVRVDEYKPEHHRAIMEDGDVVTLIVRRN